MRKFKTILFACMLSGLLLLTVVSACKKAQPEPAATPEPTAAPTAEPTATPFLFEEDEKAYKEACEAYYMKGDYAGAYNILKPFAESEYAPVRELLGTLIYNGLGTDTDQLKAADSLTIAAGQDSALALYMLGEISMGNTILGIDENAANTYFEKALPLLEEQYKNDPSAFENGRIMNAVATIYEKGYGVKADQNKANELRLSYINSGKANPLSAYSMVCSLENAGYENCKDLYTALYTPILNLAESGCNDAMRYISNYYYYGDGEVPADSVSAFEWMLKAAEAGDAVAQNDLAVMYADGSGTERNLLQAVNWYEKSVEQGYPIAEYNLASLYLEDGNEDVSQDKEKAEKLLKSAADKNCIPAQNRLGLLKLDEKDYAAAVEWFEKAASANNVYAIYNLATCYLDGNGVEADPQKALELLQKAREMGHSGAADLITKNKLEG